MKKLLLHNIRSVYNVGAIFRTADAIGVDEIIISGFTPAPIDRFGRARKDLHKAAVGAEQFVKWQQVVDHIKYVQKERLNGLIIVSLEQDVRSIDYKKADLLDKDVLLIIGSETDGVEQQLLDMSDKIVEIPMRGEKESLNVSVATGVALFGLLDR